MIDLILKILEISDMYGISKEIDIAKGVNKMPLTFKQAWRKRKRLKQWQQQKF